MSFRLGRPALYLITRGELTPANFHTRKSEVLDAISVAVQEKVELVQVREKLIDTRRLFSLVRDARSITQGSRTRLLVNDRADVAAAAAADGVHLTSTSIPASVIKKNFSELIIGVSTHTADEVNAARSNGADFALFGPIFETPGKGEPAGINVLGDICAAAHEFPVLAIGGIDETNFQDVLEAGAAGFAAIRSLNDPGRLRAMARSLKK